MIKNTSIKKLFILYNLFIVILFYIFINGSENKDKGNYYHDLIKNEDYQNKSFAIIERRCPHCGLFSFFIVSLGCIHNYLMKGYIPIIDIKSFPNVINGFNTSHNNYWELFFEQPYGYTLEEVQKNAKNIMHVKCHDCRPRPDDKSFPFNDVRKNFWHNFANIYLPIKKEIIILSNKIMHKLFKNSNNILGVLTRGTDYVTLKPRNHPIPPNVSELIYDVKEMDAKYMYDYIFFSTEDDLIRDKFVKSFPKKVKQIHIKTKIKYNYIKTNFLGYNEEIKGNIEYNKIYLLNIIILSKCLDIVTARCSGAAGIFILTNGFRNMKIYNLGVY